MTDEEVERADNLEKVEEVGNVDKVDKGKEVEEPSAVKSAPSNGNVKKNDPTISQLSNLDHARGPLNDKFKFFLANLPPSVTALEMRRHFEAYGNVNYVKLIYNKTTGVSMGYGFLYLLDEDTDRRVEEYALRNNYRIRFANFSRIYLQRNDRTRTRPLRFKATHDEGKQTVNGDAPVSRQLGGEGAAANYRPRDDIGHYGPAAKRERKPSRYDEPLVSRSGSGHGDYYAAPKPRESRSSQPPPHDPQGRSWDRERRPPPSDPYSRGDDGYRGAGSYQAPPPMDERRICTSRDSRHDGYGYAGEDRNGYYSGRPIESSSGHPPPSGYYNSHPAPRAPPQQAPRPPPQPEVQRPPPLQVPPRGSPYAEAPQQDYRQPYSAEPSQYSHAYSERGHEQYRQAYDHQDRSYQQHSYAPPSRADPQSSAGQRVSRQDPYYQDPGSNGGQVQQAYGGNYLKGQGQAVYQQQPRYPPETTSNPSPRYPPETTSNPSSYHGNLPNSHFGHQGAYASDSYARESYGDRPYSHQQQSHGNYEDPYYAQPNTEGYSRDSLPPPSAPYRGYQQQAQPRPLDSREAYPQPGHGRGGASGGLRYQRRDRPY